MTKIFDQRTALEAWRADAAKNDPPLYSVRNIVGHRHIWLNVIGNVGWYRVLVTNDEVAAIIPLGSVPFEMWDWDDPEWVEKMNYLLKYLRPGHRAKILAALRS